MTKWTNADLKRLGVIEKPKRKKPDNPESRIQRACVVWFAMQYPELWAEKRLHSIPNGGKRSAATAANMKAEGQVPGVWDLHLTLPINQHAGMWIEIKAGKNKLTPEQMSFQQSHRDDYHFAVCYTVAEFMEAVNLYVNQDCY